jgi:hypothetical protein
LAAWDTEREYIRAGFGNEYGTGIALDASRALASNVTAEASLSYVDIERQDSLLLAGTTVTLLEGSHDYDTQFVATLTRETGKQISTSIEAGYFTRSGTTDYDGWWIGLRGRWIPDLGR